jgi:malate synthase
MAERVLVESLRVDGDLFEFLSKEALPGSGITPERFWSGYSALVQEFAPFHRRLCQTRAELQRQIDNYHTSRRGQAFDVADYTEFLECIGYILPEPSDFAIKSAEVDAEIATIAGPQLVVPLSNARYTLNAIFMMHSTGRTSSRTKAD